jgi:hypothetical protein
MAFARAKEHDVEVRGKELMVMGHKKAMVFVWREML